MFVMIAAGASCQQDTSAFMPLFRHGPQYLFVTSSGARYTGFVVSETREFVEIEDRAAHEKTELRKSEIMSYTLVSNRQAYTALILGENQHARDYLFSSAAFLFRPRSFSHNTHWFLLDRFDYPFSENWAVTVNAIAFYPLSLGVKGAWKISENNYIGAGISGIANLSGYAFSSPVFMGYSGLIRYTHGNSNKNFSISTGLLGLNSDFFPGLTGTPVVNMPFSSFAYCNRFAKRVAFNIEGWYLPEAETGVIGIGFKFLEEESHCWNFGCFTFVNRYNNTLNINLRALPLPYLGLSRKFN